MERGKNNKSSDWSCASCNFSNYGPRTKCKECGKPKGCESFFPSFSLSGDSLPSHNNKSAKKPNVIKNKAESFPQLNQNKKSDSTQKATPSVVEDQSKKRKRPEESDTIEAEIPISTRAEAKKAVAVSKTLSLNASRIAPSKKVEHSQSERKKKKTENAPPTSQQPSTFFNANFDPAALVSVQSVLIQNIPPSVTSEDLKRVFLQCGPVSRVALIESTGTAILDYQFPGSSIAAAAIMNGKVVGGKQISVMQGKNPNANSNGDNEKRDSNAMNVESESSGSSSGSSEDSSDDSSGESDSEGSETSASSDSESDSDSSDSDAMPEEQVSRPSKLSFLESKNEKQSLGDEENGKDSKNSETRTKKKAKPQKQPQPRETFESSRRLCVRNLPASYPETLVRALFGSRGTITDLLAVPVIGKKGQDTNEEALKWFVEYSSSKEADDALAAFNGKPPKRPQGATYLPAILAPLQIEKVEEKAAREKKARERLEGKQRDFARAFESTAAGGRGRSTSGGDAEKRLLDVRKPRTIYLRGLPASVTETDISELFGACGKIKHVRLIHQWSSHYKAMIVIGAYVDFLRSSAARTAGLTMQGAVIGGRRITIECNGRTRFGSRNANESGTSIFGNSIAIRKKQMAANLLFAKHVLMDEAQQAILNVLNVRLGLPTGLNAFSDHFDGPNYCLQLEKFRSDLLKLLEELGYNVTGNSGFVYGNGPNQPFRTLRVAFDTAFDADVLFDKLQRGLTDAYFPEILSSGQITLEYNSCTGNTSGEYNQNNQNGVLCEYCRVPNVQCVLKTRTFNIV